MAVPQEKLLYTVEEYLEMERAAEERHEFIDGYVYAMAGESLAHSQICINVAGEIRNALRGKPCQALSPNMKVRSGPFIKGQRSVKGMFSYADLTVVCGEPQFHDERRDVLLNPTVIIEVLSESTEDFDRSEKFLRYRTHIQSLQEYVLIWQIGPFAELYTRQPNGWLLSEFRELESVIPLSSIGCRLPLREIYGRVTFPEIIEEAETE
ncbi:MAG: Uma2 family endonuclease [Blastocatellales bacterium]